MTINALTCTGTFPLDTTKARLQIQGQQATHLASSGILPRTSYTGMVDALIKIPKEEGYAALYRGWGSYTTQSSQANWINELMGWNCRISPALLRQSVYGSLKFGAYYGLKKCVPQERVYSNIFCAVVAGTVNIGFKALGKLNFVCDDHCKVWQAVLSRIQRMWSRYGCKWLLPTVLQLFFKLFERFIGLKVLRGFGGWV